MDNQVFLSLGSNMDNRKELLKDAMCLLGGHPSVIIGKISSVYETDPVGYIDQPQFLNMVVELFTSLKPIELLNFTQKVENKLGRKREIRWGPRTIDLDILLYNDENIETERLIIPHPEMHRRGFVLIPLLEINPKVEEKFNLSECPDQEGVSLWMRNIGEDE